MLVFSGDGKVTLKMDIQAVAPEADAPFILCLQKQVPFLPSDLPLKSSLYGQEEEVRDGQAAPLPILTFSSAHSLFLLLIVFY